MTPSNSPATYGPHSFDCRTVPADGPTAAWVREELRRWLQRGTTLSETRMCDIVLAVNEALANASEFAYRRDRQPGTIDVLAVLRASVLTVTITDRGLWHDRDPDHQQRSRGRGIPLMRTLADDVAIDASSSGTSVQLRFGCAPAYGPADALA